MDLIGTVRLGGTSRAAGRQLDSKGKCAFHAWLLVPLAIASLGWTSLKSYTVSGLSMQPTLRNGQRLLATPIINLAGGLHDGDMVVIAEGGPASYIVKRIYRIGGEVVDPLWKPIDATFDLNGYRVPEGSVYVLGDNRMVSEDSRMFGPVPVSQVVAKVIYY